MLMMNWWWSLVAETPDLLIDLDSVSAEVVLAMWLTGYAGYLIC